MYVCAFIWVFVCGDLFWVFFCVVVSVCLFVYIGVYVLDYELDNAFAYVFIENFWMRGKIIIW